MNLLPISPSGKFRAVKTSRPGFTLVELLVAITVLVIIILFFGQMLSTMSKAWIYGHARANNFTKARAMLDLLAQDIQSGIFRPDLAAFPVSGTSAASPYWEFYTARPGIPGILATATSLRTSSVVKYTFVGPTNPSGGIPNTLERYDSSILWTDEATNPQFGNTTGFSTTPTARDTASGVIAFQVTFIQSDGTFSNTYVPLSTAGAANAVPTRAVCLTLAVIDDQTVPKLSSAQLTALNTALTGSVAATPLHGIKSYWDGYLSSAGMNWSSYPNSLGAGLATFERYVTLPNAP